MNFQKRGKFDEEMSIRNDCVCWLTRLLYISRIPDYSCFLECYARPAMLFTRLPLGGHARELDLSFRIECRELG
jgi:hypothetical protein